MVRLVLVAHLVAAALFLIAAPNANAAPATLSRELGDYFALAFQRMRLKDFFVEAPGCNLAVNCPTAGRSCGRLKINGAVISAPGQIAGASLCGPGEFHEVFRNNTDALCSPDCSMIQNDGPGPRCENTFEAPILGDLDNDGEPSCGPGCTVDIGDVAVACGVPYPFPPCNPAKEVRVFAKSDCFPIEYDTTPGNGRCDLKPDPSGYGNIRVRNRGRINFPAGTTVACLLAVGKATRVTSDGAALVLIPGHGKASFNNLSDVGGGCREFKVVTEFGPVRFAKHGEFHLDACSLGGTMRLGHDNNLRGRFVAGEFLVSNFNSTGACCEPTTTTTSTSTSTSSVTSTTLPDGSAVCCEDTSQEPAVCASATSATDCTLAGGVPAPPGSVCQADLNGGGRCSTVPPPPGGCCQFVDSCTIGGGIDAARCSSLGGAFVDDALCGVDGGCHAVTTTTIPTTTTSSSSSTSSTSPTSSTSSTSSSSTSSSTTTVTSTTTSSTSTTATTLPPGGCCEVGDQCVIDTVSAEFCANIGGVFVENATCMSGGRCVPVMTTTSSTSSTSTSNTSTSSTTSTSSVTATTASSTTTTTTSTIRTSTTTTTTLPGQGFTRTLGFYKTHPGVTQWILDQAGGVTVCGVHLTTVDYDSSHSALEALCVSPKGDQRLQLVRQLTAAALTMAAGGATYTDFAACDALCATGTGSIYDIGACINSADAFNNSGDNLPAPFDGIESGYPEICQIAHRTPCNVLEPSRCSE